MTDTILPLDDIAAAGGQWSASTKLAVVSMAVNGDPILGIAMFIRPVAVPHVMPVMHIFVKRLGDSQRHRQQDAV